MAKRNSVVLLGYEDELITEKHSGQINFTVNKIGGQPDFHRSLNGSEKPVLCDLCKFPSRLVVQIYAPVENSDYHRTLYLFACIKPPCWNQSESWKCLRVQVKNLEPIHYAEKNNSTVKMTSTDWCVDAEDWGEDDNIANLDEENCNIISNSDKISEDEESSSVEDSLRSGLTNLSMEDKNANNGAQGGAVARLQTPLATAEIEADEDGEVVTVETPTKPNTNLVALLQENQTDMDNVPVQTPFVSYFMSVFPEEEEQCDTKGIDNHVKELLNEYQRSDADFLSFQNEGRRRNEKLGGEGDVEMAAEEYEKSRPLHGDKMFHHFVTKIKSNPEQVLRYDRGGEPVLLYPHQEPLRRCKYCQAEKIFEFQLVPTIISKLRLEHDPSDCNRLDFGTVLVYSCKNSCWETTDISREETVIVQQEVF